jgi:hypothetical protein
MEWTHTQVPWVSSCHESANRKHSGRFLAREAGAAAVPTAAAGPSSIRRRISERTSNRRAKEERRRRELGNDVAQAQTGAIVSKFK